MTIDREIIAQNQHYVKGFTEQQRAVWGLLLSAPMDKDGYVASVTLADAWPGGACVDGWRNPLHVTIHDMNKRLAARKSKYRIVGKRGRTKGGYRLVLREEP